MNNTIDFQILAHVNGEEVAVWARPAGSDGYITSDRRHCLTLNSALLLAQERVRALFDNRNANGNRWGLRVQVGNRGYQFGDWSHYPPVAPSVLETADPGARRSWQRYKAGKTPRDALDLAVAIVELLIT